MQVTINGKTHELPKEMTVLEMIRLLELSEAAGIAVAQNSNVIARKQLSETPVKDGDRFEIIQATSGG